MFARRALRCRKTPRADMESAPTMIRGFAVAAISRGRTKRPYRGTCNMRGGCPYYTIPPRRLCARILRWASGHCQQGPETLLNYQHSSSLFSNKYIKKQLIYVNYIFLISNSNHSLNCASGCGYRGTILVIQYLSPCGYRNSTPFSAAKYTRCFAGAFIRPRPCVFSGKR
mgnify:CR=1 FL=1